MKFIEYWDCFALHTWLLLSSYGIIFAFLSFLDEINILDNIKQDRPWIKGLIALFIGIIFYFIIGLRHLEGAKKRG